jgi:predicted metal-dependent phosphotriesterase family hydrolase
MWCAYGGNGYAHILKTVKDMALENGISEEVYNSILVDNVKNFIE